MNIKTVKEIYENVIQKKIIDMAIDCTLPMDMAELNFGYFENEVKDYLQKNTNEFAYQKAEEFLSLDNMTGKEAVELIVNSNKGNGLFLDYAHDDISVAEKYEFCFTIKSFLETIGYNSQLK